MFFSWLTKIHVEIHADTSIFFLHGHAKRETHTPAHLHEEKRRESKERERERREEKEEERGASTLSAKEKGSHDWMTVQRRTTTRPLVVW